MPTIPPLKLLIIYAREDQPALLELLCLVRKTAFLVVFASLSFLPYVFACGCDGGSPNMPFDERYRRADALLVGVIREQNTLTDIYPVGRGRNERIKYFNLQLLKYSKYSKYCGDMVTLFDSGADSSCEGFLGVCQIGDTVLVYCRVGESYITGRSVFHGSMCEPYSILSVVTHEQRARMLASEEEIRFIADEKNWKKPQFHVDRFGPGHSQPYKENPPVLPPPIPWWNLERIILAVSLLLNLLLLFKTVRRNDIPANNT